MARRTVTTPGGDRWTVRRLWAPRLRGETLWARAWRRIRGSWRRTGEFADAGDPGCAVDLVEELALVLAVIAVVLFVVFVGVPLLVALIDLLLLVLLTVLGIVARVVFRRPWVIEAVGPDTMRRTWRVVGWRASREAVDDIGTALAHGAPPPPGHEVSHRPGAGAPTDSS
jgi:hypothetical protein